MSESRRARRRVEITDEILALLLELKEVSGHGEVEEYLGYLMDLFGIKPREEEGTDFLKSMMDRQNVVPFVRA